MESIERSALAVIPGETSRSGRSGIDAATQKAGCAERVALVAYYRAEARGFAQAAVWMTGCKPKAISLPLAQGSRHLSMSGMMAIANSTATHPLWQQKSGEQSLYTFAARRFLDVSRVYLAFQYTGSRHWRPNGKLFTGSSPTHPTLLKGKKHVVG
jgi:hypothetical protein